jgi:hypothetical protein
VSIPFRHWTRDDRLPSLKRSLKQKIEGRIRRR